ncbi:MAG: 3-dehydroquinate synthase [Fibrobacter sp.]|nr:3-dehydroquinate synthase [Fibrobacter sp.]
MDKHIFFTGFMASGKTRVGRRIAERLQREFIDTDVLIAEKAGKSISDIFEQDGEATFRKMELELIQNLVKSTSPKVISLGGGALSQEVIVKHIRNSGVLVRLWAKPEILSERIARKNTRPLMAGLNNEERLQKIKKMLEEREVFYSKADFSVESSNDYPEEHVCERVLHLLQFWKDHSIDVSTSSGERYPIFIGKQMFHKIGHLLEGLGLTPSHQFLICTDTGVAKAQANSLTTLRNQTAQAPVFKFRAGETSKNLTSLNQLYTFMLRRNFSRKTCLLQFGGGVVGDMAGFGAATYQRGIPFIQFPTTLLSMVDSSVGGKVAVNHSEGKNMIGAFYQPKAVVCDLEVLKTLPHQEFLAGLAEIIKYGVIYDSDFFKYIENNADSILKKEESTLKYLIEQSCKIKAEVVGIDEKETGLRAILNYGHTFGHAIEKLTNYQTFSHGIAVSLGMRVAARVSTLLNLWSKEEEERQSKLLNFFGFPSHFDVSIKEAWKAMGVDKKVEKNNRNYILPTKIGCVKKHANVEETIIQKAWEAIQAKEVL